MDRITRFGSFVLDPGAQTFRYGSRTIDVPAGNAWKTLELLVDNRGSIVLRDDILALIGPNNRLADVYNLVFQLRTALEGLPLSIDNVRGTGYRLVLHRVQADDEPLGPGTLIYRGGYRVLIHDLKEIYNANRPQLETTISDVRKHMKSALEGIGIKPFFAAEALPVDDFRLRFKNMFVGARMEDARVGTSASKVSMVRGVSPFEAITPLLSVNVLGLDAREAKRVLDVGTSIWHQRGSIVENQEDGTKFVDLELDRELHLIDRDGKRSDYHVVRCFRLRVGTVRAYEADQTRDRNLAAGTLWTPEDAINIRSLRSYAHEALGAFAYSPDARLYDPWDAHRFPSLASPLWLSHIEDSARFAGFTTLASIDETVQSGFAELNEYRSTEHGARAFGMGDVTDVLANALLFGSNRFLVTYPALPETELFHRYRQEERRDQN